MIVKDGDDSEVTTPINQLWEDWNRVDSMMREFYRCYLNDEEPTPDFLAEVDAYILKFAEEG